MIEWAGLTQLTVGAVFAVAAAAKWSRPEAFVDAVRAYSIFPNDLVPYMARLVLVTETVLALSLLTGVLADVSLYASAALLVGFCAVVARASVKTDALDCGCLGQVVELKLGWLSIVLNLGLAGSAIAATRQEPLQVGVGNTYVVLALSASLLAGLYWLASYGWSVSRLVDDSLRDSLRASRGTV